MEIKLITGSYFTTRILTSACALFMLIMIAFQLSIVTAEAQEETVTREEIGPLIREYLLKNPEILIEVQQALEEKRQTEMAQVQQLTLLQNHEVIYSSPHQIEFGNPDASKTIVEFFDYNCGFCQRALSDMQELLNNDDDLRFILKEFPVLGQPSFEASRVSIAFSRIMPEKYQQFHIDLLGLGGIKDEQAALDLAERLGADREAVIAEMENPQILEAIQEVYQLAEGLGITGTPSYISGQEVVFGAVGYEQLRQSIGRQ